MPYTGQFHQSAKSRTSGMVSLRPAPPITIGMWPFTGVGCCWAFSNLEEPALVVDRLAG